MENFFNWMSKPLPNEDVTVWFNVHNMTYENIELYGDIFKSLDQIINDTYFGEDNTETKISLTLEDKVSHFEWCWGKLIKDFEKEKISIRTEGKHKEHFKNFYLESFYEQNNQEARKEIPIFINEVFDTNKSFTKSDLDILTELYKLFQTNID